MNALDQISGLPWIDFVAVAALLTAFFALTLWIEHPTARRPSVTVLMAERNRAWMREFVTRDPRIFDSQMLASLRQGTSFFASTSLLAIGGLLALMGNTDALRGVAEEIMAAPDTDPDLGTEAGHGSAVSNQRLPEICLVAQGVRLFVSPDGGGAQ